MADLRSGWRKQIRLVEIAPIIAILISGADKNLTDRGNKTINRISPYPPSLRRMAAKIIEPATGASTWAFGNQRWTKNKGSFTRKAVYNINDTKKGVKVGILNEIGYTINIWLEVW